MKQVALLVTWPNHCDFPLFRHNLIRFRHLFVDIFICFSDGNIKENYQSFVTHKLPFCTFVKPAGKKTDWRDDAVNTMLTLDTKADYYLFTEPDFLIKSIKDFEMILNQPEEFIYYDEGGRIHPAFALVKKGLVERTSHDFAAHPPEGDHFIHFFKEIISMNPGKEIRSYGWKERENFYHMAGLTQNYYCFDHGQPLYKQDEFVAYNYLSLLMSHQDMRWYKKQMEIEEEYSYPKEETFLDKFFPKVK